MWCERSGKEHEGPSISGQNSGLWASVFFLTPFSTTFRWTTFLKPTGIHLSMPQGPFSVKTSKRTWVDKKPELLLFIPDSTTRHREIRKGAVLYCGNAKTPPSGKELEGPVPSMPGRSSGTWASFFERCFQQLSIGRLFSNQRESIFRCPKGPFPSKPQNFLESTNCLNFSFSYLTTPHDTGNRRSVVLYWGNAKTPPVTSHTTSAGRLKWPGMRTTIGLAQYFAFFSVLLFWLVSLDTMLEYALSTCLL